jgi:hypothetical protein
MDDVESQAFKRKLQERLAASRFFTFSLLLHVILLVFAGSIVLFKAVLEPPDFVSEGAGGIVSNEVTTAPPEDKPDASQEIFTPDTPQINAPAFDAITTTSTLQTSFKMASLPAAQMKPAASDISKNVAEVAKTTTKGIGVGVPTTMAGRIGGTARAAAMVKNGGKEKSEKAVMAGLRWLRQHQNEDGSWATEYRPSMTGFAILCFLGHGETPESPEFGPTVKKGLDWLLAKGTETKGRMSMTQNNWGRGIEGVYEHAVATYAIGEYYTMTKDERFADLLKQAVTFIVQGQAKDGGWSYKYENKPASDTSVSGWQIQALKAAHLTGLEIPGVQEALDKAMLNLKRVQASDGSFGYHNTNEARYSLSGVGVLCTYFWKEGKDKSVKDGIEYILKQTDGDNPIKYKEKSADLYAWYYNTQACLMYGGSAWSKWNRLFQDEIADNQDADGSWPAVGGKNPGGELQQKKEGAGPNYRTCLCILMLEVFYRYMPVTKG